MRKIKLIMAGYLMALVAITCSLPTDPGPQPSTIVDTEFDSALNILGILRLDGETNSSYFYIERTYRYQELDTLEWDESFIPIVTDATVCVQGTQDATTDTFTHELDSLRGEIYTNQDFVPVAGETYTVTIEHGDFPTITDTAVVPEAPRIDESSLTVIGELVYFNLLPSADIHLYDVYLLSPADSMHYRFPNPDSEPIPIGFPVSAEAGDTLAIHVYGYDANLAEYLTSTITLKPQTYQETVTTVTGGYGVFGAVSVAKVTLPF